MIPRVDKKEALEEFNLSLIEMPKERNYDSITIAVAHDEFKKMGDDDIRSLGEIRTYNLRCKKLITSE